MPVKKTATTAKAAKTVKPAAKKAVVKKTTAKKPAAAGGKAAVKTTAKKAPEKKTVPTKKPVAKKQVVAKPAAKKAPAKKGVVKKAPAEAKPKKAKGLPEQMCEATLKVLSDRKAQDVVTIDLRGRSALADYAFIASGGSARQLAAIAQYIQEAFAKLGIRRVRVEGLPQGDWVLIDAGDVLIHLFRPEVRTYYQLEDIWTPPKK